MCSLLIKNSKPGKLSLEMRVLSLNLLRELMQANLEDKHIVSKPSRLGEEVTPQEVTPQKKKKNRGSRVVQRKAMHVLMKGVDVLKLRNTQTRINRRVSKLQDSINRKLSHIITQ